ncbi:MAG: 2-phosphosulfolactate phosphatase [Terrimicrobiaceae bacterium]
MESSIHDLRDLKGAPDADAVVVIDVLRAFSTAAVALDGGAKEIYPVLDVAEAFERREHDPDLVLMGETDCHPVPGFDLGNSPVAAAAFPFQGRRAVQRTTAGTRGLVCCAGAPSLWAASFLVATATVAAICAAGCQRVGFVITGGVHYGSADEDLACAEWMAGLLRGETSDVGPFLQRVRDSVAASTFLDPASPLHAPADVDFCARADVFPFAMKISEEKDRLVLRRFSSFFLEDSPFLF